MLKRVSKFILISTLVFSIFSCKNFMNSGDFLTQLNEQVWNVNHEQPVAKIISPVASPSGDHKNVSIIVDFTKTMNPETFNNGFFVKDSAGNSLREHYDSPIWNEDFTQVVVPVNKTNLLEIPKGEMINIKIVLTQDIKDTNNTSIANPCSESYYLNSTNDVNGPVILSAKLAKKSAELENEKKVLISGELTDFKDEELDNLIKTNHINNTIYAVIEGFDYENRNVWANFEYKRIYSTNGDASNEPSKTYRKELTQTPEGTSNKKGTVSFTLADNTYSDGLYQVDLFLTDGSNNAGPVTRYYVTVDTRYDVTSRMGFGINLTLPDYRQKQMRDDFPMTINNYKTYTSAVEFYSFPEDIYLVYGKTYSSSFVDFNFYFSYGTGPSDKTTISSPVKLTPSNRGSYIINFPQELINYIDTHTDINVYIELSSEDPVGNSILLATYIPPKNIFYNYTITSIDDNTSTVTLNFDDKAGNDAAKVLDFQPYKASALTCIYYAKKIPGVNINDLVLERNFLYDENPNSSRTPHRYDYDQNGNRENNVDRDPYGSFSDPHDFVIDNDSEYIAVIHTSYPFNINDTWCNTTSSVLCVIDNISVANANLQAFTDSNLSGKTITALKNIDPAYSGIATINVRFPDGYTKDDDVNYYYGWSPDNGTTWSYFDTNPFTVSTPLNAPANNWYFTSDDTLNKYNNEYTHTSAEKTYPIETYTTNAKVKILAQKDGASGIVESAEAVLTFTSNNDDNTPPVETSWIKAHELSYSADGSYFYTPNSLITDNEWNPSDEYTYYYTQFNPSWLAQTNILSENEIKQLPHANQKIYFSHWKEDGAQLLHYNQQLSVPVNGLSDGDYMIFYTVSDKHKNSTSGTLGRIQIGTFKNKLSVNYNNNNITAELKLESNESFQQNNFFAEFFEIDKWKAFCSIKGENSSITSYIEEGKSFSNLFYFCSNKMKKSGNKLTFASNDTVSPAGYNNYNQTIPTGKFYRMNVTSANIDSRSNFSKYNDYGNPEYSDESGLNPWTDRMYYDIYTNETASYPTYIYIPSSETEVENVKHSLDPFSGKLLSNKNVLINVISSLYDLGDNIDEWERRGKVIKTEELSPTDNIINFTYSDAQSLMFNSGEKGKRYYVITYHFIDNESSISKVFTSY